MSTTPWSLLSRRGVMLTVALLFTSAGPWPQAPTVHLIGDSTMADKPTPERNPERGWPGEFALAPGGRSDDTHLSPAGVAAVAELAVARLRA